MNKKPPNASPILNKPTLNRKEPGDKPNPKASVMRSFVGGAGGKAAALYGKTQAKKNSLTQLAPQANTLAVFDDDGLDVTPQPLGMVAAGPVGVQPKKGGKPGDMNSSTMNYGKSTAVNENPLESQTSMGFANSMMGRSALDNMLASATQSVNAHESINSSQAKDFMGDRDQSMLQYKYYLDTKPKMVKQADMNEYLTVKLTETDVMCLLDLPSVVVLPDTAEEFQTVKAENERYLKVKEQKKYSDNYTNQSTQCYMYVQKTKEIQTNPQERAHVDCWSNEWIIYDACNENEDDEIKEIHVEEDTEGSHSNLTKGDSSSMTSSVFQQSTFSTSMNESMQSSYQSSMSMSMNKSQAMSTSAMMTSVASSQSMTRKGSGDPRKQLNPRLFKKINQEQLAKSLFMMERAIMSNIYESLQFVYRGLDFREEYGENNDASLKIPSVKFLWSFRCELAKDRVVTCMTWNRENKDVVAVGFSNAKESGVMDGLVLCFTLKNPDWPERKFVTNNPVTSLDFSTAMPNLLAVGMRNGSIALYDVRSKKDAPALENRAMIGRHRDSVWELRWVADDSLQTDMETVTEALVSVSSDGRVIQWSVLKGWEYRDIMVIKMSKESEKKDGPDKKMQGKSKNSLLNRVAGGLSIDFSRKDNLMYLLSTDEGMVYSCSRSYNEQFLATYAGHTAPVYKVRWCPLCPGVFLSCSGDWTMKLWSEHETEKALMTFMSEKAVVLDVTWSPMVSTVFGSINATGSFELWDLQYSTLDPAIKHQLHERNVTAALFAKDAPIMLLGDQSGLVSVYRLDNIPSYVRYQDEKIEQMGKSTLLNDEELNEELSQRQAAVLRQLIHGNQTNLL